METTILYIMGYIRVILGLYWAQRLGLGFRSLGVPGGCEHTMFTT